MFLFPSGRPDQCCILLLDVGYHDVAFLAAGPTKHAPGCDTLMTILRSHGYTQSARAHSLLDRTIRCASSTFLTWQKTSRTTTLRSNQCPSPPVQSDLHFQDTNCICILRTLYRLILCNICMYVTLK